VRLAGGSFTELNEALLDAFSDVADFRLIARCLDTRLQDLTAETRLPDIARRLVEWAEGQDRVEELVECAKRQNRSNRLLQGIGAAGLVRAPTVDEIVDARSAAADTFNERLKGSLAEFERPGMEMLAAGKLTDLLDEARPPEVRVLLQAILGNLKVPRSVEALRELIPVFSSCLRRYVEVNGAGRELGLSLARAQLQRADLSELDLHRVDVAFSDLRHADLTNTNLWRARGYAVDLTDAGLSRANLEEARLHFARAPGARFHDCRMVSVFLKESDLAGASFQSSRLQGAHLEKADLRGARFEESNLADAYFHEATIDDVAAASIARARNWKLAFFDRKTRKRIEKSAH
jgi:hypothetical protein